MKYSKEKMEQILSNNGVYVDGMDDPINVDSITFVTLVVDIEREFDIEYPDDNLIYTPEMTVADLEKIIIQCESSKEDN